MNIKTRFAPSPTGKLHIGGARTALFNYLFSKHNNAEFFIRIENTDVERSTIENVQSIEESLNWLGILPTQKITFQSDSFDRHVQVAKKLLNGIYYILCMDNGIVLGLRLFPGKFVSFKS